MINIQLGDQQFQWKPQEDITTYELALCTEFLFLANLHEPYYVKEQELAACIDNPAVRRHFVDVTSDDRIGCQTCFGWGVYLGPFHRDSCIPITAQQAHTKEFLWATSPCPECGSGPEGAPKEDEKAATETCFRCGIPIPPNKALAPIPGDDGLCCVSCYNKWVKMEILKRKEDAHE